MNTLKAVGAAGPSTKSQGNLAEHHDLSLLSAINCSWREADRVQTSSAAQKLAS